MWKSEMEEKWEAAEVLELSAYRFLNEIKEKLDIYDLSIQINNSQIETLFHDVLELEMEEVEAPEITRGCVYIKKNGTGKYYTMKNLYFHLMDFIEGVFNLAQTDSQIRIILGTIFLFRIMTQLGVDLSEEQATLCIVLYQMTKRCIITDDNIMKYIKQGLQEGDYCELGEEKIEKELSKLVEMGLVSIEDGRYEVTETLLFT